MRAETSNLSVAYGSKAALRSLDLALEGPGLIGLLGANGAGKSTLLKALCGITPYSGQIRLGSKDLRHLSGALRTETIAYLAQFARAAWPITVRELVALGRLSPSGMRLLSASDQASLAAILEKTATAYLADRNIDTLSGGEHARVQLARVLFSAAPIVLVDEPVALLDPFHQLEIMRTLRAEARSGRLVIAVLHDLTLAARFCDQVVLLREGRMLASGTPADILVETAVTETFSVTALRGEHEQEPFVIPWQPKDNPSP